VDVQVGAALAPTFSTDVTAGCTPLCVAFSASEEVADLTYTWDFGDDQNGSGWQVAHCFTESGTYDVTLTITDAAGCSGIITLDDLVNAWPQPHADFSPSASTVTTEHPLILFADGSTNTTRWLWHFGDVQGSYSEERSPAFTFPGFGCYTVMLVASNDSGCVDTHEQEICVEDPYAVYVPNTFTPNGDDINDRFGVVGSVRAPRDYRLMIFDRWGRELFSTTEAYQGWDGAGIPEGVYIWKLAMRDTDSKLHEHVGHVTLIR
jgi:gliding motility-associated-like protein